MLVQSSQVRKQRMQNTVHDNLQGAPPFQFLAHTADVVMRVHGKSKAELLRHALFGMSFYICEQAIGAVLKRNQWQRHCTSFCLQERGRDFVALVVNSLSTVLCDIYCYRHVCCDVHVIECSDHAAVVQISMTPMGPYEVHDIKAVTFHGCHLEQDEQGWWMELVFDI